MPNTTVSSTEYVVYLLTFPNGKKYVGYTQSFRKRMGAHKNCKDDTLLYRAVRKYSWENVRQEIIDRSTDIATIRALEQAWCITHNCYSPFGYNSAIAGSVSPMMREEVRVIASQRMIEAWKSPELLAARSKLASEISSRANVRKIRSENALRRWSDPSFAQMTSANMRGIPKSAEHRQKLRDAALRQWAKAKNTVSA
jgi:hypothetical protein